MPLHAAMLEITSGPHYCIAFLAFSALSGHFLADFETKPALHSRESFSFSIFILTGRDLYCRPRFLQYARYTSSSDFVRKMSMLLLPLLVSKVGPVASGFSNCAFLPTVLPCFLRQFLFRSQCLCLALKSPIMTACPLQYLCRFETIEGPQLNLALCKIRCGIEDNCLCV